LQGPPDAQGSFSEPFSRIPCTRQELLSGLLASEITLTVIVVENLDRLHRLGGWIKVESLKSKLIEQFGVIYRHWIPNKRILVDGVEVQAVDPLFLMEHGRFYDETPIRAVKVDARTFEVETPSGKKGKITIRASHLPANFQLVNPSEYGRKGAKNNKRFDIMRAYNGPRLRKIRDGLDLLGLNSDQLLMHGNQRLVYGVPLARNFREYLLGRDAAPEYLFSLANVEERSKNIARWWAERWLSKRIEREDVLNKVAQHRLTYPVRHGARVQVPTDDETPHLPFAELARSLSSDVE
jgi:hypothetical protein